MGWPGSRFLCEESEGFQTAISIPIGLTIADGGLAQQINRPGFPMFPNIGQPRHRFLHIRSRNKGARHMLNLASDRLTAESGPQIGGGHGFESPVGTEECRVSIAQILA